MKRSRMNWTKAFGPGEVVGTAEPCRCFHPLELALGLPDGCLRLQLGEPECSGSRRIRLSPGEDSAVAYDLRFCFHCGGRLGRYRREVVAAYERYLAASEGYASIQHLHEWEALEELARSRGAVRTSDAPYARTWEDREACVAMSAVWDADHETILAHVAFSPPAALVDRPFEGLGG